MKMTTRRARTNRTENMVAETSEWVPTTVSAAGNAAAALSDAPLFEGWDQDTIADALVEFDDVHFPTGHRVVLEGLRGSDFFLVVAGKAAVLVDGWRVAALGPGDFFGELAILGDGLRSASVRAETPLHCLVLPNGKLETLILQHPQLGINLIRSVIRRYQGVAGRRQPPASEIAS
ncbi:MAG: cyclic nucleotide-binding domain-containing protein [Candidatus Dormibacteraeota bacterium]|nr:cyclic nucleotide-binding domain-containing protein [Candidatus Dormibacteraeota bacterium]